MLWARSWNIIVTNSYFIEKCTRKFAVFRFLINISFYSLEYNVGKLPVLHILILVVLYSIFLNIILASLLCNVF